MKATNGVSVHRDGYGGEWHPAINVKVYRLDITADDVRRRFGCCEKTACEKCWRDYSAASLSKPLRGSSVWPAIP